MLNEHNDIIVSSGALSGQVSSSCSTNGIHGVTLVANCVIGHECYASRIMFV